MDIYSTSQLTLPPKIKNQDDEYMACKRIIPCSQAILKPGGCLAKVS